MLGINFHRDLQEVKRPNRSGRASAFDRHLPLDLTAHTAEPSVVGAFVGATLADYGESKQQSNERNHSMVVTQRSSEEYGSLRCHSMGREHQNFSTGVVGVPNHIVWQAKLSWKEKWAAGSEEDEAAADAEGYGFGAGGGAELT